MDKTDHPPPKFNPFFNFLPIGYVAMDKNGQILEVNQASTSRFGIAPSDRRYPDYLSPNSLPAFNAWLDALRETQTAGSPCEVQLSTPDDTIIHVRLDGLAIQTDGDIQYHLSMYDISDQKRAEASTHAKSAFLARMSHEIRTPMNAVVGFIDLALNTDLNPLQREYLEKSRFSVMSLTGILSDILDFSKIEAGKLDFRHINFSLSDVIVQVTNTFSVQISEKEIFFSVCQSDGVPDFLVGDPMRLRQILVNLVGNAIKFTETGGVVLRILSKEIMPSRVNLEFSVIDTGIGFDAGHAPDLFNPFIHAGGYAPDQRGTGLGLNICKNLVEMMGGQIVADSQKGKGSVFTFSAVFEKGTNPSSAPPKVLEYRQPTVAFSKEIHVLLVEDDIINQMAIQEYLENYGIRVDTAQNGREAIEAVKQTSYDVILMDVDLPEINGQIAAEHIRARESEILGDRAQTPIIAMTAYAMKGDMEKCLKSGMNDYLAKPFENSRLLAAIYKWANHKKPKSEGNADPDTQKQLLETANQTESDSGQLTGIITELAYLLEAKNLKAIGVLSALKEQVKNTKWHDPVEKLGNVINRLDYVNARLKLNQLASTLNMDIDKQSDGKTVGQ